MKLSILHKGILLLLVPLTLQVVFLFQLLSLAESAERLAQEEFKLESAVQVINELQAKLDMAAMNTAASYFVGAKYRPDPVQFKQSSGALIARAKTLVSENPRLREFIKQAEEIVGFQLDVLAEFDAHRQNWSESHIEMIASLIKMRPRFEELSIRVNNMQILLTEEQQALQKAKDKDAANRVQIKRELLMGVLGDVLLTVAVVALFLSTIKRRLGTLKNNASLIPTGQPLTEHVSGHDELAYLDTVLHSASESIRHAAEYRQSLIGMLAHDLRSPLAAATATLDTLLLPEVFQSEENHALRVTGVKRNLRNLLGFIEDLLTLDRLEAGKLDLDLEAIDLHSLVAETFDTLKAKAAEKNMVLENTVGTSTVVADRKRILQVLMNLVANAIKYSPNTGCLSVSSQRRENSLIVSVRDQGPGIEKGKQAELFEKFYQVDKAEASKGFGLGLAICKMIIDQHQGQIGVISDGSNGTIFWFSLPWDAEIGSD